MKKQITLAVLLGMAGFVSAQSYVYTQTTGTSDPYNFSEGTTTTIFEPPTSSGASLPDQLSSLVPLPFSWQFYGSAVSGYYASDNGYITFDNTSPSSSTNDAPPTAAGPNNAIYAFWDDIEINNGSGATDYVKFWTYGEAPNRVHVIQWFSVTPGDAGVTGDWLYAAIRIYECGDFDIVHNYSQAVTGMTATVGCENSDGTDGTLVAGSPSLDYPSITSPEGTDDIVYRFYYGAQPTTDLQVISESNLSTNITSGSYTLGGEIYNGGSATVTSFDLNYTVDGGSAVTMAVTGSISANGTYTYSHSTQMSAPSAGVFHDIKIWASNINGNSDELTCNDTVSKSVFVNTGTSAARKVLIEEFTGTWCGYCPDGHLVVDDIISNGYNIAPVMIHSGSSDPMEIPDGAAIDTYFDVTGYPGAMIDRTLFSGQDKLPHSRGAWATNVAQQVNAYSPAYVAITNNWNEAARQATVTVTANFIDYAAGDMRLNLYVVEDNVTGGSSYDQSNYMNTDPNHALYGAGNPIVGYVHNDVLRAVPSGPLGTTGVIPSVASPGGSYSHTYTYTVPGSNDASQTHIIGFASYINSGDNISGNEVINASNLPITVTSIGEDPEVKLSVGEIYPNPTSTIGFLDVQVDEPTTTKVEVCNVMGQTIKTIMEKRMAAGSHAIAINTTDLSRGLYYANVYFGESCVTKKFVVIK